MVPPPKQSKVTGDSVPACYIHADARHFRDVNGRTLLLRGVNLSSSAKVPRGRPQHVLEGFWEAAEEDGEGSRSLGSSQTSYGTGATLLGKGENQAISYVGQTLNLEDGSADAHLARLRQWGFNCVRFVTVWEALEHEGPGIYDEEYMDYVVATCRKLKDYGFRVYMDPHQDLFSRYSGGSGAPLWTIYACGLNPRNFTVTGAAYIQAEWPHPDRPDPASFPAMIWASGYTRLAVQTINTLFWAGKDFAPLCVIDGVNIQDYLQRHFLHAYRKLAEKLRAAGDLFDVTIIGWDSINEPNHGYLGTDNLSVLSKKQVLRLGPTPTAFEGMRLGMGESLTVENYRFGPVGPQRAGSILVDPAGKTAWLDPNTESEGRSRYGWHRDPSWPLGICIWALHGVWDPNTSKLLVPDYFLKSRQISERPADFAAEYWRPHLETYAKMIRSIHSEAIIFAHPPVFEIPQTYIPITFLFSNTARSSVPTFTTNWFNADALGILRGNYASVVLGLKIGETAIRKCLRQQLGMLRQDGLEKMGEFPTMMGRPVSIYVDCTTAGLILFLNREIGIPYDLDKKAAYGDGDYNNQLRALDASLNACDGDNVLNYTIWSYCPDNSHLWGDLWNGEDLSIWSSDDATCQDSTYAVPSKRYRRKLSRPHRYHYGARSREITPFSSSLSLNTLADPTPPYNDNLSAVWATRSAEDIQSNASRVSLAKYNNINLNDGARALAAFCRPYPTKTVGVPLYLNFDIKAATFDMRIEFNAGDVEGSDLATEIYIPAAHFAAKPSVLGFRDSDGMAEAIRLNGSDDAEREVGTPAEELDIDVVVSAGEWTVDGQFLRWTYPTGVHTLSVSRKSGAIPAIVVTQDTRISDNDPAKEDSCTIC